jgi:hypothetical protein
MDKLKWNNNWDIRFIRPAKRNYMSQFIKGIYRNLYCEVGIICNEKEISCPEYSRQLCLFEIVETKGTMFIYNKNDIYFPESEYDYGKSIYALVSCNGATIWSLLDKTKYVFKNTTVAYMKGHIMIEISSGSLEYLKIV